MYKHFKVACLCSVLIFTLNVHANVESVNECHEQFRPLTISEIQKIFSDKDNYKKYKEQSGYLLFAQKSPNIKNMEDLFELASEALGNRFKRLGWKRYRGTPEQMREERGQILEATGELKAGYIGMGGYGKYAMDHHGGDMFKAFEDVVIALGWPVIRKLNWRQYHGIPEQMREERGQILNEHGRPKAEYLGMEGYRKYATDHHGGDMFKAYQNVVAVLEQTADKELDWRRYHGTLEQMREERGQILNEHGKPKAEYLGMEGYIKYTEDYYEGDMFKAYENVVAVLGLTVIKAIGWEMYKFSSSRIRKERGQILDNGGELKAKYRSMAGYSRYAAAYYEGDMQEAHANVLAVLNRFEFGKLGWKLYQGSSGKFTEERKRILRGRGYPRLKYIGMKGCSEYAAAYYKGNMQKAYENVLAVLGQAVFKKLGWRQYQGSSGQFEKERARILNGKGKLKAEYFGMNGCSRYAADYHGGDMHKAYRDVLAVLGQTDFNRLNWQQIEILKR